MGADPRWVTLALALPGVDERWLEGFSRGFFELAGRERVELIGGDTTRGPLTISITAIGLSPPGLALRRDGARPGDDIWLSGRTGEAALAVAVRRGALQLPAELLRVCRQRLDWPQPRNALGLALRGIAASAIDVSDGLLQDLGHLCERSGIGARLELARLPVSPAVSAAGAAGLQAMLSGGDDYELCFTASPAQRERLAGVAAGQGVALTRIGQMSAGPAVVTLLDAAGAAVTPAQRGFDHFR